ncbi:unnamed protein product, partial [Hapterophycus canaliculatus]
HSFPAGPSSSRRLEALIVAVNQASDMRHWYTVTKEFQLASMQVCEACRGAHTVHLRVDGNIPKTLLPAPGAPRANPEGGVSSRVPRLRVLRVTWARPSVDLLSSPIDALAELSFGPYFNQPVECVAWPTHLEQLTFGCMFDQPVEGVTWPMSLQQLTFRGEFNQKIERMTMPSSLLQLQFSQRFNQSIEKVVWPTSLRHLSFGPSFNQPIDGVTWPASLQQLFFGYSFNQPIEGVS